MDKNSLRQQLLLKRQALPADYRKEAHSIIHKKVIELCQNKTCIGMYVSLAKEVETKCLIEALLKAGKRVFIPRCHENTLTFHEIKSLQELVVSRYQLMEPTNWPSDYHLMEIIFVPLVGFDRHNNRLGYGKGYYDSILNQLSCPKIGLAYHIQLVDQIPIEAHDIALDSIITD